MSSYLNLWQAELNRRNNIRRKAEALADPWLLLARPNQRPPEGDWFIWFIRAGRGWGKTRTGAEWIKQRALAKPGGRFALVAQTFTDGRDVMVEGESGLLSILAPSHLRGGSLDSAWNRSLGELYLSNSSRFKVYSSEKPRQLRGPQHHDGWVDEPASFADAHLGIPSDSTKISTVSNFLMGLRLGSDPRAVITGTPQPNRLVRDLIKRPGVVLTVGRTSENRANLAETYIREVVAPLEGTRAGRQELEAELLEDTPGALWTSSLFEVEGFRVAEAPSLRRIVVGVDPSASNTETSDEMGIVVVGRGFDDRAYVLADRTIRGSANYRASRVVSAFHDMQADKIVLEVNNGGDWIPALIGTVDKNAEAACTSVHATRGKQTRAEPQSSRYEKGLVSHVGLFPELEAEMTGWIPGQASPNRMDALVWAMWELFGAESTWEVL